MKIFRCTKSIAWVYLFEQILAPVCRVEGKSIWRSSDYVADWFLRLLPFCTNNLWSLLRIRLKFEVFNLLMLCHTLIWRLLCLFWQLFAMWFTHGKLSCMSQSRPWSLAPADIRVFRYIWASLPCKHQLMQQKQGKSQFIFFSFQVLTLFSC